jgi:hypothetical protein
MGRDARKEWMKEIDGIEGNLKWLTFTPRSEQELFAEQALMRELHKRGEGRFVNDAWKASFLPPGALVEWLPRKAKYFVVRAYRLAAVLWPAAELEIGRYERDESASSLVWATCFAFEDFLVLESTVVSPLHCMLKDRLANLLMGGGGCLLGF